MFLLLVIMLLVIYALGPHWDWAPAKEIYKKLIDILKTRW